MTILGSGNAVVDASPLSPRDRVFHARTTGGTLSVTLSNLTIVGGFLPAGAVEGGGAVFQDGSAGPSTLTLGRGPSTLYLLTLGMPKPNPDRRDLFPGALELMVLQTLERKLTSFERLLAGISKVLRPAQT